MRRLTALFVLAALLQSVGCVPFEPTVYSDADGNVVVTPRKVDAKQEKEVLLANSKFKDVPIPLGYKIDYGQSRRYQWGHFRKVSMVYRQRYYKGETRDRAFVKREFPKVGWELKFVYGLDAAKFIFHKGNEECRVEVEQDFRHYYTEIRVVIEPRKTPTGAVVARPTSPKTSRTVKASKKKKTKKKKNTKAK
jgi:hypothetical protein